ncbi:MAG: hypothetical protein J1E63_07730 [Muribaculaceae bacterium]|nr:hypothetical protein [Muribaculaceae bacterium]
MIRPAAILLLLLVAASAGATSMRTFIDNLPVEVNDTVITLSSNAFTPDVDAITVEASGCLKGGRGSWGIRAGRYDVMLSFNRDKYDDLHSGAEAILSVIDTATGRGVQQARGSQKSWNATAANTIILTIEATGRVSIDGGYRVPEHLLDINLTDVTRGDIAIVAPERLFSPRAVIEVEENPTHRLSTAWDIETVEQHIAASTDPMEAIWEYLDGTTDPNMAVAGGRYRLATITDGAGGYHLIYLGGATISPAIWQPGMVKGHLSPTIFANHYNVTWNDSQAEPITLDVSANVEQGAILSIAFPRYRATLRFSRLPR